MKEEFRQLEGNVEVKSKVRARMPMPSAIRERDYMVGEQQQQRGRSRRG